MPTPIGQLLADLDPAAMGDELWRFAADLFPICRSITGLGLRQTLARIAERIPLEIHDVPSGTPAFDWTVPPEWNVRDAWVKGPDGAKVIDFRRSNLHLVSYSTPVHARMPLAELMAHLHSLPEKPDLIPYRTSYYRETWGFCLAHRDLQALPEGEYEVLVDSTLALGSLTYGECFLRGSSEREILISCHVCHPSLANDNLSGLTVATHLARALAGIPRRYSYRLLFIPGTIGAITWLSRNEEQASRVAHGLVVANLGDPGSFHYKKSRRGAEEEVEIDRAVVRILKDASKERGEPFAVEEFVPFGYDERQYSSPGFDLAVGSLTRTPWGRYPEYHTSADDLDFIRPESLAGSLATYLRVLEVLEANRTYYNVNPKCEPQLGRRGLYRSLGGGEEGRARELALLWVLNLSDGAHDLLAIAERSGMSFGAIREAAEALVEVELLR